MQRSALCRSRGELSNEYLLAKIGVDTAENEPLEVWVENSIHYSLHSLVPLNWHCKKDHPLEVLPADALAESDPVVVPANLPEALSKHQLCENINQVDLKHSEVIKS